MELENPENPFEGGVTILAKPSGKQVKSIQAMSGGEKSLTSLALIFAMQEVDPSPFYVFDEIDAGLRCHERAESGESHRAESPKNRSAL